jgi:hypothetical protein
MVDVFERGARDPGVTGISGDHWMLVGGVGAGIARAQGAVMTILAQCQVGV